MPSCQVYLATFRMGSAAFTCTEASTAGSPQLLSVWCSGTSQASGGPLPRICSGGPPTEDTLPLDCKLKPATFTMLHYRPTL